jgi:hypothetical protein
MGHGNGECQTFEGGGLGDQLVAVGGRNRVTLITAQLAQVLCKEAASLRGHKRTIFRPRKAWWRR